MNATARMSWLSKIIHRLPACQLSTGSLQMTVSEGLWFLELKWAKYHIFKCNTVFSEKVTHSSKVTFDIFITSLHPSISQAFPVVWSQQELIDASGLETLQEKEN